jgi:prophage tail gpP-like protein
MPVKNEYVGTVDERVRLVLGVDTVRYGESYEVRQGLLEQPGQFSLMLGRGDSLAPLIAAARPNLRFQLFIGDTPRFLGETQGHNSGYTRDSPGYVNVEGADFLAPLYRNFIRKEESLTEPTNADMVRHVLKACGISAELVFDNAENRRRQAGGTIRALAEPNVTEETITPGATAGSVQRTLRAQLGESYASWVKRELDRAGLFMFPAADGRVVMSRPNAQQLPCARIVNRGGHSNVEACHWGFRTARRYAQAVIYGRYGGKKWGPAKAKGVFDDEEMQAFGFTNTITFHDVNVANQREAEFYASRKLAESRRAGFTLTYTVAGHSTPGLQGGGRIVWTPDTMVEVDDERIGVHDQFWVESCVYKAPPTTTEVTLMRPADLLFGLTE